MKTRITQRGILAVLIVVGGAPFLGAEPACSLASFRGTYGFANNSYVIVDQALYFFAAAGRVKSDGANNLTVQDTASSNGQIQRRTYTGIYTLGDSCQGTVVFTVNGATGNFDIVVSPDGTEIQFIQTDPGVIGSGTARRHSLPDKAPVH